MTGMGLKALLTSGVLLYTIGLAPLGAEAFDRYDLQNLWDKPVVRQAAVGAAAGVAVGALSERTSVTRGTLTGAVTGAGTGLLSQSSYLENKPLLRNSLQGAVIGTGTSYATGASKLKGAVIGAGGGAGYHYIRRYLGRDY